MAIGIDDLYDEEDVEIINPSQEEEPTVVEEPS
jgi:hypothetical protein